MKRPEMLFRVAAICGTSRPGNFTGMALNVVTDELEVRLGRGIDIVDPATLRLPFPGMTADPDDSGDLKTIVQQAAGVVIATPEYHGTFSAALKLVFENLGFPSVLAGKPVALLGVAAGRIGAIKSLEALQSMCLHVGAVVLPGSYSVSGVRKVFDEHGQCQDESVERGLRRVATNLIDYLERRVCPAVALEAMARETS